MLITVFVLFNCPLKGVGQHGYAIFLFFSYNIVNKTRQGYALYRVSSNWRVTFFKVRKMNYDKPYKSIQEQIDLLQSRGLIIDDPSDAIHYLHHLNYYRLAGYWLSFEENHATHFFRKGTRFSDVLNLYIFDRELRLLLLDAIERIEISIRAHWAYYFAETYGSHAHLDKSLSKKSDWHEKNIGLLNEQIKRSDELFIKHYQENYNYPVTPPIWAICEVISLGLLSRWLKSLRPGEVRSKISHSYQLDYVVLASFVEHLTYLRNVCAHHSRLWNRRMTKTMQLPRTKPANLIENFNRQSPAERKIYNTLVMLLHLLAIISPGHHLKSRLVNLFEKHSIDTGAMGFPVDWLRRSIWIN
jgi:abortive infection bacteriophage resistance protein